MTRTPAPALTASARLTALAVKLTEAEAADRPDPGVFAGHAWDLLGELSQVTYQLEHTQRQLAELTTAAQAALADARDNGTDPVAHLRELLRSRGQLPPPHVTSAVILAWTGTTPARHRRQIHWFHRHPRHIMPAAHSRAASS